MAGRGAMAFPRQDAYRKKPTGTQRMVIALRIFRKKGNKMTPMEAWSIVAPILAAHSLVTSIAYDGKLNAIDEAYVIVFGALNKLEKEQSDGIHVE